MARRRKRKRSTFSEVEVREHISRHHPACPVDFADAYVQRIASRTWDPPTTLGHAVGLTIQNAVRHRLTDYDQLLRVPGLTRDEARLIVAGDVRSITRRWASAGYRRCT